MLNSIQETIDTIVTLREKKDHKILESLEYILRNSIDESISIASDIMLAETWLNDIADILLWKKDNKWERHTDEYKAWTTSVEVEQKLSEYIYNLCEEKYVNENKNQLIKRSKFLNESIEHIRKTYCNWKEHIFTCYDKKYLDNTNLELEKSHSKMKRKHRRITWLKNSHQYLLIHWEHFAHVFNQEHSMESMMDILKNIDYSKLKEKQRNELLKSKQRSSNNIIIKNSPQKLKEIITEWEN